MNKPNRTMTITTRFGIEFNLKPDQIYLDSATIGKIPVSSMKKILEYYKNGGGAPVRGVHSEISSSNRLLEKNRQSLSSIFNVESSQISFFPSRETVLTSVFHSIPNIGEKRVVTSILEEHSILAPAIKANNSFGTKIDYLNIEDETNLVEKISEKIHSSKDIVLLSSLTATNGVKREWNKISKICKEVEATFILDISYSVGHEEIMFDKEKPDIVVSSGCMGALGPASTAFQITNNEIYDEMDPLIVGGGSIIALEEYSYLLNSSGSKFETGIINVANINAMTNSLELLSNFGLSKIQEHEKKLHSKLRTGLEGIPSIKLNKIEGAEYGPILSFGCEKIEAHDLAMVLDDMKNIQIRSGALCSHLYMYELKFNDIARVSTHLYNTEDEIIIFLETVDSLITT
jgi:cysteine desulfurase/selenocysteine lyase